MDDGMVLQGQFNNENKASLWCGENNKEAFGVSS